MFFTYLHEYVFHILAQVCFSHTCTSMFNAYLGDRRAGGRGRAAAVPGQTLRCLELWAMVD